MTGQSPTPPLIEIKNLRKVYQTPAGDFTAVNGINVEVQRGEFIAIIGKSGSGKSTFINMITSIDRPTSGEIVVDGAPVQSFSEGQMAADSSAPKEVQELGSALQRIMLGDKNVDLSSLPREWAELIKSQT